MEWQIWAAVLGFGTVFVLITFELVNKTAAALAGAALFIVLGLTGGHGMFEHIDWEVIFLLVSMMIIVSVTQRTGLFQWVAIKMAKSVRGNPVAVMIGMSLITAVFSAFLDNVTTVLILAPIAILIAVELGLSPLPFLITMAVASNIGGTATLIGDPPNIMIGLAANLSFTDFLVNLTPAILVMLLVLASLLFLIFNPRMKVTNERRARILELDENKAIENPRLLLISLGVLLAVIAGFLLHSFHHVPLFAVAMVGAVVLLLVEGKEALHHRLQEVEWETIFFFVGLFIMVGGLEELGVIKALSDGLLSLTAGDIPRTSYLVLWASGLLSGVVDNIPYVATMIPLVQDIQAHLASPASAMPLWWALSLGACLGGNLTLVGASANVVTAGLAAKNGYKITFLTWFKYGAGITLITLAVSTVYLWAVLLPKGGY